MIAIVFTFPEPDGDVQKTHDAVSAIMEAVKKRVNDVIPDVKGYIASHDVADQVVNIFKAESN